MKYLTFDEEKDRLRVQVAFLEKTLTEMAEGSDSLSKDDLLTRLREKLRQYRDLDEYEEPQF